jgi:hypothetical protein
MSNLRLVVLAGSAGGILMYIWALYSMEVLAPSLVRIVSLVVSVIVLGVLYVLAVLSVLLLNKKRNGSRSDIIWAVIAFLAIIACFIATTFVMDWGAGASLRTLADWSSLPEGNLLIAGGRAGWTLMVLFGLVVTSLLWEKLKFGKLKNAKPSAPATLRTDRPESSPTFVPIEDQKEIFDRHQSQERVI